MILAREAALKNLLFFPIHSTHWMSSTLQPSMARRGCGGTQKILCFFTVLSLLINFLAHSFGWQPYKIKCCYCFHGCIHKTLPAHSRDHHTLQETTAPPPFPHSRCTRWLFVHSFLDTTSQGGSRTAPGR